MPLVLAMLFAACAAAMAWRQASSAQPSRAITGPVTIYVAGALTRDVGLCLSWGASPFKTIDDARHHTMVVAGTGAGSETDTWPAPSGGGLAFT